MSADQIRIALNSSDVSVIHSADGVIEWIKEGSGLDRRMKSQRREYCADRRNKYPEASSQDDRRERNYERRSAEDRRRETLESIKVNSDSMMSYTEILSQSHYNILKLIEQLIGSIRSKNIKDIDRYIKKFSAIIRSFSHREDLIFHAYFDTPNNQTHEDINSMLMILNLYIYKSGEEILEILNQYINIEVDEKCIEHLVIDLEKINEILLSSFTHKNEFLYSKYQKIPNF